MNTTEALGRLSHCETRANSLNPRLRRRNLTIIALLLMFSLSSCNDPGSDEKPIVIVPTTGLNPPPGPLFQTSGTYQAMSFHTDSKEVVTSTGSSMDAWNIETGTHLWRIPDTGSIHSVRHLGDSGRLVTIEAPHIQPSLVIYDIVEEKEILRFDTCNNAWTFSLSPDGSMVATAAPEDPKPSRLNAVEVLQGEKAISPNEEFRAMNTQNCAAAYNVETGEQLWKIESVARPTFSKAGASRKYDVYHVAFSPDQKILLCMDSGGSYSKSLGPDRSLRFSFWNVSTGEMLHDWVLSDEYRINNRDTAAITWSKDGKFVVIQAYEGQQKAYTTLCVDPATGDAFQKFPGIGVNVEGDRFVACDLSRKEVVFYNLETGKEQSSFKVLEASKALTSVTASQDGRWLAGFHKNKLYVFDLQKQKQTAPLAAGRGSQGSR